jgi:hypothetical protein
MNFTGFQLNRNYTRLRLWTFSEKGALIATCSFWPNKGLSRRQRYCVLEEDFNARFGAKRMPPYIPLKGEK